MTPPSPSRPPHAHPLRAFVRRHERRLIAVYLGLVGFSLGAFALFGIALQGAESLVDRAGDRWTVRVSEAEELVREERWSEAERALLELDREHPARSVLHGRDRERERILTLLARSQLALERKRATLETCARLVAFDPLNWKNYDEMARAAAHFGEVDVAAEASEFLLELHGTHWPTVRRTIETAADAARFADAVAAFEHYLDVRRPVELELTFETPEGEQVRTTTCVPTDGRLQEVTAEVALPTGWHGTLTIASNGYSLAVSALAFAPRQLAGRVGPARDAASRLYDRPVPVRVQGAELVRQEAPRMNPVARLVALDESSAATFGVTVPETGSDRVWIALTAYKHVDDATWRKLEHCLVNLLEPERAAEVRARTCVGGCLAGGSEFEP